MFDRFEGLAQHLEERRRIERFEVHSTIQVAEWDGGPMPPLSAFRAVEARDLATSGISFFDRVPPRTERVILLLGTRRRPIYVASRVVHSQECLWNPKHLVFVGCEFLERIDPSAAPGREEVGRFSDDEPQDGWPHDESSDGA